MAEQDIVAVPQFKDKEPWLAVCLSDIIPGIGHFYAGKKSRGLLFLIIFVLAVLAFTGYLLATWPGFYAVSTIALAFILGIQIWAYLEAFRFVRSANSSDFEADRTGKSDPWRVLFFSRLFCGLGYFLIKGKRVLGVLAVLVYFGIWGMLLALHMPREIVRVLIMPVISVTVCLHSFTLARRQFNFRIIIFALLIIFLSWLPWILYMNALKLGVFHAYRMSSESMEPSLKAKDRVIGNLLSYHFNDPEPGDIIVFKLPDMPAPYTKRIAAVGGERVRVEGAKLFVNGKLRDFAGVDCNSADMKIRASLKNEIGVGQEFPVPRGEYYLLGDNRALGWDSRNFGPIERDEILGKVVRVYWPLNRARVFQN
jgi:signal peptidase I